MSLRFDGLAGFAGQHAAGGAARENESPADTSATRFRA